MQFTFKTIKPTGPHKSFFSDEHIIKLNGMVCGSIDNDAPHSVRLMAIKDDIMEDANPNCIWKWVKLKKAFESVQGAKDFLKKYSSEIQQSINIFCQQD